MKVLFLGNSYTYYNDMPKIFAEICREHGHDVTADSVTHGGYSFEDYLTPGDIDGELFLKKLRENRYDIVVLQEQSVRPALNPDKFLSSLRVLVPMIREADAEPVLYETWGRRDGHETLEKHSWTHEQMQEKLKDSYTAAGEEFGIRVVYAGERFHRAYRSETGDKVFFEDGTHPSPLGSAIVALEFYRELIK